MNTTDFEKGRKQTNYHNLKNRCPRCGHRLEMKDGNRCTVILRDNDDVEDPKAEAPCGCRKHRR